MSAVICIASAAAREWAVARRYKDGGREVCKLVSPVADVYLFVVDGPPQPDRYGIVRGSLACQVGGSANDWRVTRRRGRPPAITAPRGKRSPAVSVARAGSRMVVAFTGHQSIGVDVEVVDRVRSIATPLDAWLSVAEQHACAVDASGVMLAGCWALKEALGKALGIGFPSDPATWSFNIGHAVSATGVPRPARFWLGTYNGSVIALALPSSTTR